MKIKYFPLVDILEVPKIRELRRSSLIFLISLIAHYHEKQRHNKGNWVDDNINQEAAIYRIKISQGEIEKKFAFSQERIIRAKEDLKKVLKEKITIKPQRIVSIKKEYYKKNKSRDYLNVVFAPHNWPEKLLSYEDFLYYSGSLLGNTSLESDLKYANKRLIKYLDIEDEYFIVFFTKHRNLLNVPVKVVYDKTLSDSEKLAIIWNIALKEKLARQPTLIELESASKISERTFRKAKSKYRVFFKKEKSSGCLPSTQLETEVNTRTALLNIFFRPTGWILIGLDKNLRSYMRGYKNKGFE